MASSLAALGFGETRGSVSTRSRITGAWVFALGAFMALSKYIDTRHRISLGESPNRRANSWPTLFWRRGVSPYPLRGRRAKEHGPKSRLGPLGRSEPNVTETGQPLCRIDCPWHTTQAFPQRGPPVPVGAHLAGRKPKWIQTT